MNAWAHTAENRDWEPLEVHLNEVGRLAEEFASAFSSDDWGKLAGLWHDLGKYSTDFQDYLESSSEPDSHHSEQRGKIDHTSAGAQWAAERFPIGGLILSYVIAGHHAGLLDYYSEAGNASLENRLAKTVPTWFTNADAKLLQQSLPKLPQFKMVDKPIQQAFRVAFWVRMLFSCLVDADFLATESFMNPEKSELRPKYLQVLSLMKTAIDSHLERLSRTVERTAVNQQRAQVLEACRLRAADKPGFFELCVPTGGGKTFSSLVFGLNHALANKLKRVIVAVPFTSIIEQNAAAYRNVFSHLDKEIVVEHHSNVDPEKETSANRLQAENWDAPLIVTTNVQLFESLFASRTSRCRKIHRLAKSVIILDEVQTLPVDLLEPTILALGELVETYGSTVVLCSATQPALSYRKSFPIGLKGISPIIDNAPSLYQAMRRTTVKTEPVLDDEILSGRLLENQQVLCIVNSRAHAASLFQLLGEDAGHFHLSTNMCAAHRLSIIDEIRERLRTKELSRVVSTQLIEAGVDLDFPIVFRARCGLDSLAQAAGRCNREGLRENGEVIFFASPKLPPPGYLRQTAQSGEEILKQYSDLLSPEAINAYFNLHYWLRSDRWDFKNVLETVGNNPNTMRFQFAEMASRYRFIDDEGHAVLVPWKYKDIDGERFAKRLNSPIPPNREEWRKMQRFCVQVRQDELEKLKKGGAVELRHERWVLVDLNKYDDKLGLVIDRRRSYEDNIFQG